MSSVNMVSLKWHVIIGGVATLVLVLVTLLVLRPGPHPLCHRAIDGALQQWMIETHHTNTFPNANGHGIESLAMIHAYFGDELQQYGYVPGLRYEDPNDLVFMYLRKKTRYTWHGDTGHNIFSRRRWMVLSPDIVLGGTCPEGGELLDTPEFKKRLRRTVAFIKDNQRPYWQTVANEQSEFLNSITE